MKLYCGRCQTELKQNPSEDGLSAMEQYVIDQGLDNLRVCFSCSNPSCENPTEVYVEQI